MGDTLKLCLGHTGSALTQVNSPTPAFWQTGRKIAMKLDEMRVHYDRDELRREDLCADPWHREMRTRFPFLATVLVALVLACSLRVFGAEWRVLVYQKNGKGFVHDNLAASAAAIRELGKQNGFGVDVSTNPVVFADGTLKKYRALIFANSNNEAFENDEQRSAFQRYIRGGGGFAGIHSSTGSERQWTYFQHVQGAKFLRHSPLQKFTINVLDPHHPATAHLANTWAWEDECYFFTNLNPGIKVLLAVDTKSLKDPKLETAPGQKSNGDFPLAWYHECDGGRVFYTSLGHKIEYYSDPVFRQHLLGGIRWVMGEKATPQAPLFP
jgi:type 1 glutamine amidotransferase